MVRAEVFQDGQVTLPTHLSIEIELDVRINEQQRHDPPTPGRHPSAPAVRHPRVPLQIENEQPAPMTDQPFGPALAHNTGWEDLRRHLGLTARRPVHPASGVENAAGRLAFGIFTALDRDTAQKCRKRAFTIQGSRPIGG